MSEEKKPEWQVRVYPEDMFALKYRINNSVEFEIHMIAGEDDDGYVFQDERNTSSEEVFKNPSNVPIDGGHIMYGVLRFDGCINIQQTHKTCMMHFCGFGVEVPALARALIEIAKLGQKMGDCWHGYRDGDE